MTRFKVALELLALAAALTVGGCESSAGPAEVKLGRDVCEMCGMIISDPRDLAAVRLDDNQLHKFDDVGEAVNWLSQHCVEPKDAREFWVTDSAVGKSWLDGRKAYYRRAGTPMNYGFAAVAAASPETVTFDEMRAKTLRERFACKKAA